MQVLVFFIVVVPLWWACANASRRYVRKVVRDERAKKFFTGRGELTQQVLTQPNTSDICTKGVNNMKLVRKAYMRLKSLQTNKSNTFHSTIHSTIHSTS